MKVRSFWFSATILLVVLLCGCQHIDLTGGTGVSVMAFGAKGDGVTDDTAAIQAAINFVSDRGGGKIRFPYTPHGYRIAGAAVETVNGKPCRGQLYIPPKSTNIAFEGEMPCKLLYTYQIRPPAHKNFKTTNFDF